MHYLIVSDLPEIGGSSTICVSLVERFRSWGAKVTVLSRFHQGYRIGEGAVRQIEGSGAQIIWSNRLGGGLDPLLFVKALLQMLLRQPTHVIVNGSGWSFAFIRLLLPASRFIYYYINHDPSSSSFNRLRHFGRLIDGIAVITVVSLGPVSAIVPRSCRVCWLPQFTEPIGHVAGTLKWKRRARPVAGFVGYLTEAKGVLFLLDEIHRADLGCDLLFLGDGPCRSAVVEASLASDRVSYAGAFDPGDRWHRLPEFFHDVDFLVMPSMGPGEGIPTVILEALYSGVPVLATNQGGIDCFNQPVLRPQMPFCVEAVDIPMFIPRLKDFARHSPFGDDHAEQVKNYFKKHFGSAALAKRWKAFLFSDDTNISV